jgi:hypothetical protein
MLMIIKRYKQINSLKWTKQSLKYFVSAELVMEHYALKTLNNWLNTNIYSYLKTSGGQSWNLYLNVAHFSNASVN